MRITISRQFPQFNSEEALFLVTGKQDAKLYRVYGGSLELIDDISVANPHYSDKEGMFGFGSVLDDVEDGVVREFMIALKHHMHEYTHKYNLDSLYIFTPSFMKKRILAMLSHELKEKVSYIFDGNLYHKHPHILLERIKKVSETNKIVEPRGEAKKILEKAHHARHG